MKDIFRFVNYDDGIQTFESARFLPRRILKKNAGRLHVEGILHTIYAKHCFVLYNYHGMHFTSKRMDTHYYMLHFPLGIPLLKSFQTDLIFLDAINEDEHMDIHMEVCDMTTFSQHDGLCSIRTTQGQDFVICTR